MKTLLYIIFFLVIAVGLFFGYIKLEENNDPHIEYIVQKQDLVQKVIVNGNAREVHAVNLSFENAGRILSTEVKVGDRVTKGQALIILDSTALKTELEKAKTNQGEAEVKDIESQISKMTLESPQDGKVTTLDAKKGQTVTPNKSVASVIADGDFQIEAYVSEVKIGKISVGNKVSMTLEAFPDNIYSGIVSDIESTETVIDGIVNYKVTVVLDEEYSEIKRGLTARLEIITNTKKDILVIPEYSLIKKDRKVFVLKKSGQDYAEVLITVGIRGDSGFVEVLSGLSVGDVIDSSPK